MLFIAEFSDVELKAGENTINIAGKTDWTLDFVKMAVIKSGQEGEVPEEQEFLHKSHITRSDSAVPGYAVDVTKIDTNKKSIEDYQKEFTRVDEECGYAWNYDWDADKNQMNILKAAAAASGEDFIAEAFSNSPPYFMTNSGCSSGAVDSSKDNLRADSYQAFAAYMADVIEHWNNEGVISFQSATPMNEPYTNYWGAHSNKQEGCHFDQGELQSKIITALKKELDSKGISIILSGTDETSIDTAISSYNKLSQEAKDAITRIDTHTYGGSKRAELKELAEKSGENLWMSEVDGSYTAGSNAGEMSPALGLAKQMMKDVNGLQSSAWIFWNAIDMHVDQKVTTKSDADYGSLEEIYSKNNDMKNAYWGLAIGDHDNQEIVLTKKYYAYGQFSRYIRPGYAIISSSDDTLAAYDPKGKKVVIVAANTAGEDQTWQFDLSKFNTISDKITAVRTSGTLKDGENWADVSDEGKITADTAKKNVTAVLKANSITTYTIEGVEYDSSAEEIVSIKDVAAYTVEGVPAALPEKVEVTTNKNNTSEMKVTWNLENADLTVDGEIKGAVKGTDIKATAHVKVVEPNTVYFIDCNSPESPKYAAVDAYADGTATQEMVNNAVNELIDAVTHLLEKDFSYLIAAIEQAKGLLANEERYTASSAGGLKEAVAAAEQLVESQEGDTADIDSAYGQILSAIAGLELRGNRAELESVLKKAEEILGNSGKYLASTLEGLQEAYDQAKAVYDNADAVQSEITEATVKLLRECMDARILGDVDMNGIVDRADSADSALMLQYSAELTDLTEEQALVGDVNGDGRTDTADASKVLEFTEGKIEAF